MSLGRSSRPAPGDASSSRTALVTGATSGLGREVAERLGREGFRILVHGRSRPRGEDVVRAIEEAGGDAAFHRADFAALDEVRSLANEVRAAHDGLHVLVNNAGVYPGGRTVTEDGYELGFQVNHLAHFLLTLELLPLLRGAAPARVVNVSSGAQEPLDFDDPMLEEDYSGSRSYARSKLAQVLFTFELARRTEDDLVVNALHPATYMDTRMVRELEVEPRSTVSEGAEAVMRLVLDEDVGTGGYFDGSRPARAHDQAYDPEARERLWEVSEELVRR